MMSLVIVVVLATSLAQVNANLFRNARPRIVGGHEANPNQFPHQVALLIDGWRFCGGTIIATKTIVTAAHCLNTAKYAVVIAGAHNIDVDGSDQTEQYRQVFLSLAEKFVVHPDWNPNQPEINDIALVILSYDIILNGEVAKIDLHVATCPDISLEDVSATISGWGQTSDSSGSSYSGTLRYASDKLITNSECNSQHGNIINTHVCLNGENKVGTCYGDSGGPLVYYDASNKTILAGITSFGSAWGCQAGFPSVYTRVSCFKSWIDANIEPKPTS